MADKRNNLLTPQEVNSRLTPEEMKAKTSMMGKASGKKRREKADLFRTMDLVMSKPVIGKPKELLESMGYTGDELSMETAILATLAVQAVKGDKKASEILLNYRMQMKENDRKDEESKARIHAMGQNAEQVQVSSDDDDDGGVVIYLPKVEDPEASEPTSEKKEVTEDAENT